MDHRNGPPSSHPHVLRQFFTPNQYEALLSQSIQALNRLLDPEFSRSKSHVMKAFRLKGSELSNISNIFKSHRLEVKFGAIWSWRWTLRSGKTSSLFSNHSNLTETNTIHHDRKLLAENWMHLVLDWVAPVMEKRFLIWTYTFIGFVNVVTVNWHKDTEEIEYRAGMLSNKI